MKKEIEAKIIQSEKKNNKKKLKLKAVFYYDKLKYGVIGLFSSKKSNEVDRRLSRRIYEIIPDSNNENNRKRHMRTSNRRIHTDKIKKKSKSQWFKNTTFIIGNVKITRFAILTTAIVVVVFISGTFALAASNNNKVSISSNDEITSQTTQNTILITYGDITIEVQTYASTVQEALEENDISYDVDDVIYPHLDQKVFNKTHIKIKQPFPVSIIQLDDTKLIYIAKGTVADALDKAGIEYDEDDRIVPDLNMHLTSGIEIIINKVDIINVKEEIKMEYETEYGETSTVVSGMYAITQKGKDGIVENTIAVTYVDGTEESREIIETKIIKEPRNKIVLNGTGVRKAKSSDDDDYEDIKVTNPGEQATNPDVHGAPGTYIEKMTVHATAYTHTGRTTATGTWPRSTRTLANPGSCAVVPGTFPYGSLIYVTGYGYCIAEDTGGFRHDPDRWNQIDLFMNTVNECVQWGRRREWTAYVLRYGH